ncbi:hypothetical protein IGI58_001308 [Enterococcus sp. AZ020]|uniref:hypothetical protein n=2 Tax=unclassified Enterococcus TaxID=2608891 RepID=UPI003D26EE1F
MYSKERLNQESIMPDNYKKKPVAIIPYKTLEMIQTANGEEVLFYAIFKCLDEMKQKAVEKNTWQIFLLLEDRLYKKDPYSNNILVFDKEHRLLDTSKTYVMFLKKDLASIAVDKYVEEIQNILTFFGQSYREVKREKIPVTTLEGMRIVRMLETDLGY